MRVSRVREPSRSSWGAFRGRSRRRDRLGSCTGPRYSEWVQQAIDLLVAAGELEMTTAALGSPIGYRSAFLGAVLRELDRVEVMSRSPASLRRRV